MSNLERIHSAIKCCVEDEITTLPCIAIIKAFEDHLQSLYEVMPDSCKAFELDPRGYKHTHGTYNFRCDSPHGTIAQIIRAIIIEIGMRDVIIVWRQRITIKEGSAICRLSITQR